MNNTLTYLLLLTAFVLPQGTYAQTSEAITTCASMGDFSDTAFDAKYAGVPLTQVLDLLLTVSEQDGGEQRDEVFAAIAAVARGVYSQTSYHSVDAQTRQASIYRSQVEAACLAGFE